MLNAKQLKNMEKSTFEIGKVYGNDLHITIVSRTAKTITIETQAWGVKRVKIRDFYNGTESISFKAWIICATELFDAEIATQIAFEKAYN